MKHFIINSVLGVVAAFFAIPAMAQNAVLKDNNGNALETTTQYYFVEKDSTLTWTVSTTPDVEGKLTVEWSVNGEDKTDTNNPTAFEFSLKNDTSDDNPMDYISVDYKIVVKCYFEKEKTEATEDGTPKYESKEEIGVFTINVTIYPEASHETKNYANTTDFYKEIKDVKFDVTPRGGNPDGWKIEWTFKEKTHEGEKYTLTLDQNTSPKIKTDTIEVSVRNYSPDEKECLYEAKDTLKLLMYPTPDWEVKIIDSLRYQQTLPDGALVFIVDQTNESTGNWKYEWSIDGEISGLSAKSPEKSYDLDKKKTIKIVGTATYLAPDSTEWDSFGKSFNATIYATPRIELEPVVGYMDSVVTVKLISKAYESESKWTIDWFYDGQEISDFKDNAGITIALPKDTIQDSVSKCLSVKVTNTLSEYGKPFDMANEGQTSINCTAYSLGAINDTIKIEGKLDLNATKSDSVKFSIKSTGGYPDGWHYQWIENGVIMLGEDNAEYILKTAPNDETKVYEISVTAYNKIGNTKGYETEEPIIASQKVTVWSKCEFNTDIEMIDNNRIGGSGKGFISKTYCIREGNKYQLRVPYPTGGYQPNGNNNYWLDGFSSAIDGEFEGFVKTFEAGNIGGNKKGIQSQQYKGTVINGITTDDLWDSKTICQNINVYAKPQSPSSVNVMGNGKSGTVIAVMPLEDDKLNADSAEYYLVFGYTDNSGKDHESELQPQGEQGKTRWYTFQDPSVVKNSDNRLYAYSVWKYPDAIVTSGRTYVDQTVDECWDGSLFGEELTNRSVETITRSDDASSIRSTEFDGVSCTERIYTLDGQTVDIFNGLPRGIYIRETTVGTHKIRTKFIIK